MITTPRRRLAALVAALTVVAAACGTSGGNDAATTTTAADATTTTAEETTTTEASGTAEAQARADAVELTDADFPSDWSSSPADESDGPSPLDGCDPSFTDDSSELATNKTDTFTTGSVDAGDGAQFRAETKVFVDEAAATAALDPFSDPDVLDCIDGALKEAFGDGQGATVTGTFGEDDIEVGADQSEGASAEYTIEADDGSSADVAVAVLLIRTGDLATMITIQTVGSSFEPSVLQAPVERIVELQAA